MAAELTGLVLRTANLESVRPVAPPSVLPDISPTRGEIGRPLWFRQSPKSKIGETIEECAISPLVGEMSGRTEGGNVGPRPEKQLNARDLDG
jgi:hypothetical protein